MRDPKLEAEIQKEVDAVLEREREARDAKENAERAGCPECLEIHDHADNENPL